MHAAFQPPDILSDMQMESPAWHNINPDLMRNVFGLIENNKTLNAMRKKEQ